MAYKIFVMTMALLAGTTFAQESGEVSEPIPFHEDVVVESFLLGDPADTFHIVGKPYQPGALTIASEMTPRQPRPYLGVRIDPEPLPELLVKHLRLEPGIGLRVQNVLVGSPADKAGIEQDDLIIKLNGKDVKEYPVFVETIQNTDVNKEISLEIIHLGDKKAVKATIAKSDPAHEEWKYPVEPEISYSWNPGRIFRLKPDQQKWLEVPMEKMPDIVNQDYFKKFMNEVYSFSHVIDGKPFSITIQGDPKNPDTEITVKADSVTIQTTIGKIDQLPEPYRKMAKKDVESARKTSQEPKDYRQDLNIRKHKVVPEPFKPELIVPPLPKKIEPAVPDRDAMNQVEKQMKELQKQMEQMEQRNREMMEKLEKQLQKLQKSSPDASPQHTLWKVAA